jgi:hypothetical protein
MESMVKPRFLRINLYFLISQLTQSPVSSLVGSCQREALWFLWILILINPVLLAICRGVTTLLGNIAGTEVAPSIGVGLRQKVAGTFARCHGCHVPWCIKESGLPNLYIYIYMSLFVYLFYMFCAVYMQIYTVTYIYHVNMYVCIYIHTNTRTYIHIHIYINIHIYMYIYLFVYLFYIFCVVYMQIYTVIYIYHVIMYVYIYIYTHTRIQI